MRSGSRKRATRSRFSATSCHERRRVARQLPDGSVPRRPRSAGPGRARRPGRRAPPVEEGDAQAVALISGSPSVSTASGASWRRCGRAGALRCEVGQLEVLVEALPAEVFRGAAMTRRTGRGGRRRASRGGSRGHRRAPCRRPRRRGCARRARRAWRGGSSSCRIRPCHDAGDDGAHVHPFRPGRAMPAIAPKRPRGTSVTDRYRVSIRVAAVTARAWRTWQWHVSIGRRGRRSCCRFRAACLEAGIRVPGYNPRRISDHRPRAGAGRNGPMAEESTKYLLGEDRIPRAWYNIAPDMPVAPPPPLHPGTHQPIGPDDLAPLFPMSLIAQEVSTERYVEIPDPVRDVYRLWRPTPALPRAAAGAGAGPAGRRVHLLQVRGHQPGRQPQAETRPCRRVLQRRGGRGSGSPPRPGPASGAARWRYGLRLLRHRAQGHMVRSPTSRSPYGGR